MYYNVKDLMKITGLAQSKCYSMIRELNKSFKKTYPNAVLAQGNVLKWWFEECMGIKEKEGESNELQYPDKFEYSITDIIFVLFLYTLLRLSLLVTLL